MPRTARVSVPVIRVYQRADVENVLLSIVVPVYAVPRELLTQCLNSLLSGLSAEEASAVEIIAVNDASPGDCREVLDGYAGRHRNLRVVHLSQNVGLGLARNAGLAEATGAYVWFVDSDDRVTPGAIGAVLERLVTYRPDVLLVDHLREHEDGRFEVDVSSRLLRDLTGSAPLAERRQLLQVQHTAWNRVVRLGLLRELDLFFRPGWYEDVPFSNPVLIGAGRIAVLDRVCYLYRVARPGAITATRSERHFEAFAQYDRQLDWVAARKPSAWLTAELFTLMINHLLVVAGNDGRLDPGRRRAFFRRIAGHYRRHRPAAHVPPGGAKGLKHRLVAANAYGLYALLRAAYQARGGTDWTPALRPDLVSAPSEPQPARLG
jgi:glycosyltransferase involved in cell wall biosynthesis